MMDHDPDEAQSGAPAAAVAEEPAAAEVPVEREVLIEVNKDPNAPKMSDEKLAEYVASGTPPDDEVQRYNKQAQKRMQALRTAFAEQRRRTDQFAQDAATASTLAERLYRENQELRTNVVRSEHALVEQALARAESQLKQATSSYKAALGSGDADLIAAANVDVARAAAEIDRLKLLRPAATSAESRQAPPPAAQPQGQPPPRPASQRVQSWVAANPWFNRDQEMTEFAMLQHRHLALDGITEDTNPDLYFRTIEDRLAKQFPERFQQRADPARSPRPAAAAGGVRTNGGVQAQNPNRVTVRLNESQMRLINRLGITPEEYAKQLVQEEQEKKGSVQ